MVTRYTASYNDYYDNDDGEFVTYQDYVALETRLLALLDHPVMKAHTGALREAQITGLAFIRVNANGHVQALPSDRVRISVIQAVEERTAAAAHPECDHDYQSEFNGVGYDDICSKCGDTRPEECDHLWVVGPSCGPVPEYLECVKCRKQKPLGEDVCE